MAVVLSPWPAATATVSLKLARNVVRAALPGGREAIYEGDTDADGDTIGADDAVAGIPDDATTDRLGGAASAQVERYAPDAPQVIRNEAVIRVAGWLHTRKPQPMQSATIGSLRVDWRERFYSPSAMVNSGARALLQPWRARRALPVEEAG